MNPTYRHPTAPNKAELKRTFSKGYLLGLSLAILPIAALAQVGAFNSTYTFNNTTTSSGQNDPTPNPTAGGLTLGAFSAHGVSANSTAGGRFAFSGWNATTPGVDTSKYYEMTLSPNPGSQLDLDSIAFGVRRTGTGPRDFSIRSSLDGFGTDLGTASATSPEISVLGNSFHFINDIAPSANIQGNTIRLSTEYDALTTPITFRFYAANPETAAGSFTLDDVTVKGVTAVPEPHEYGLAVSGALMLFAAYKRQMVRKNL
jgi:hypothetical protein